jgi:hypothetical protein
MVCKQLRSLSVAELINSVCVRERVVFENSPQVVFVLDCPSCLTTHSVEFSFDEVPKELATLRYTEHHSVKQGSLVRTFAVLVLLLLALFSAPVGAQSSITTNCSCSGYYLGDNETLLVPVTELTGAPLVNGRISRGYGWGRNPFLKAVEFHGAIDIAAKRGTPIYAFSSGIVERVRLTKLSGNWLLVRYGKNLEVGYSHLDSFAPGITVGTHVKRGDVLGKVGSTGRSTGPHLDIRIYVRGRRVRPECSCYPVLPVRKERGRIEVKD